MTYPPPPPPGNVPHDPPRGAGYPGSPPGSPGGQGDFGGLGGPNAPGGPSGPGGPGFPPGGGGSPYGSPQPPEKKSRIGLWIAIACAVVLLLVVVLGGAGVGAWLLLREPAGGPDTTATAPQDPTDEQTDEPSDEPTDEPTEDPTEGPTEESTEQSTDESGTTTLRFRVNGTEEISEVETNDGPLDPENGMFFGAEIEITNESGSEEFGLAGENFTFYDDEGNSYHVRYGRFSTTGPQVPPGETATAQIYADVEPGTTITEVSYTDEAGTGGHELPFPIE